MMPLDYCPFCGGHRQVELWEPFDAGYIAHVHCERCGAGGPSVYSEVGAETAQKEAHAAWNRRWKPWTNGGQQ